MRSFVLWCSSKTDVVDDLLVEVSPPSVILRLPSVAPVTWAGPRTLDFGLGAAE